MSLNDLMKLDVRAYQASEGVHAQANGAATEERFTIKLQPKDRAPGLSTHRRHRAMPVLAHRIGDFSVHCVDLKKKR